MNDLQTSLFDTMKLFADSAVANSDSTITIEAIISSIVDGNGNYEVEYLGSKFKCQSNTDANYAIGDNVYVLIPNGDFSKNKLIIGLISANSRVFADSDSETGYEFISDNFASGGSDIISFSSYASPVNVDLMDIIIVDTVAMRESRSDTNYFELSFAAKTNLDQLQQKTYGNYGLKVIFTYYDLQLEYNVTKMLTLDTQSFNGNPYALNEWTEQSIIFKLENAELNSLDGVAALYIFADSFISDTTKANVNDIYIKDISIRAVKQLSNSELSGYNLTLSSNNGTTFCYDYLTWINDEILPYWSNYTVDADTNTKVYNIFDLSLNERNIVEMSNTDDSYPTNIVLRPTLTFNGKPISLNRNNSKVYWFVENAKFNKIYLNNEISLLENKYPGWFCLNDHLNETTDDDGNIFYTLDSFMESYNVTPFIEGLIIKDRKVKCVIEYGEWVFEKDITIANKAYTDMFNEYSIWRALLQDSDSLCAPDTFVPGIDSLTIHNSISFMEDLTDNTVLFYIIMMLEFSIFNLDKDFNSILKTYWCSNSSLNDSLQYSCLNSMYVSEHIYPKKTTEFHIESVAVDLDSAGIEKNIAFTSSLMIDANCDSTNFDQSLLNCFADNDLLKTEAEALKFFSAIGERNYNILKNIEKGIILFNNRIELTPIVETEYTLEIVNDNVHYKYDANGNSPMSGAYKGTYQDRVSEILPLSFNIKDKDGNYIAESQYSLVDNYYWSVNEDSLIELNEDAASGSGSHGIISYNLADRYNKKYANNKITLTVNFADRVLTAQTSILTTKEGLSGSNGTSFAARIVCGDSYDNAYAYNALFYSYTDIGEMDLGERYKFIIYYSKADNAAYYYDYDNCSPLPLNKCSNKLFTEVWYNDTVLNSTYYSVQFSMFDSTVSNCSVYPIPTQISGCHAATIISTKIPAKGERCCNIVQAKITIPPSIYNHTTDNIILYAYYPIDTIVAEKLMYCPYITGGFAEVIYNNDGSNPVWDETEPFRLSNKDMLLTNQYGTNIFDYNNVINAWNSGGGLSVKENYYKLEKEYYPNYLYKSGESKNYISIDFNLNNSSYTIDETKSALNIDYAFYIKEAIIQDLGTHFGLANSLMSYADDQDFTSLTQTIKAFSETESEVSKLDEEVRDYITEEQIYLYYKPELLYSYVFRKKMLSYNNMIENGINPNTLYELITKAVTEFYSKFSPLMSPYNPIIQEYMKNHGLYEKMLINIQELQNSTGYLEYTIPIVFYYDRTGLSFFEAWDGNKLEMDNSYLIAPQVGAGAKVNDKFNGIVMGEVHFSDGTKENGLFAYNQNKQTFKLKSQDGSLTIGSADTGQIEVIPGEEPIIKGQGMEFKFGQSPQIYFNDGVFKVDELGNITATSGKIGPWFLKSTSLTSNESTVFSARDCFKVWANSKETYGDDNDDIFNPDATGFYLGSDGMSFGDGNFSLTPNGSVRMERSYIGRWFLTKYELSNFTPIEGVVDNVNGCPNSKVEGYIALRSRYSYICGGEDANNRPVAGSPLDSNQWVITRHGRAKLTSLNDPDHYYRLESNKGQCKWWIAADGSAKFKSVEVEDGVLGGNNGSGAELTLDGDTLYIKIVSTKSKFKVEGSTLFITDET